MTGTEVSAQVEEPRRGPLVSAGVLIGAGMGGFVDGIVLHQILQLHNMLSGVLPPDTLIRSKVNMYWDGVFHAGVWLMTAVGIALLFQLARRADVVWSGRVFTGALCAGWGLFNIIEGIIDHQLFGLHHVLEYADNHAPADYTFLAFGAALLLVGAGLIRTKREENPAAL